MAGAEALRRTTFERQMREQRNRMAAMLAFLDQQVPPSQGEGHSP